MMLEKDRLEKLKNALTAVIEALEGLDEETQRRVLETVAVFYEIKPKPVMRGVDRT